MTRLSPGLALLCATGLSGLILALSLWPVPRGRAQSVARSLWLSEHAEPVVRIEAGWFVMGSDERDLDYALQLCAEVRSDGACAPQTFAAEAPAHRAFVGAFAIDRMEVSREAYQRCVRAQVCSPVRGGEDDPRLGLPEHPVVFVDAGQAERYCGWAGGRLPTEAEWERAARGGSQRRFPWGYYYNSRVANHGRGDGQPDSVDGYAHAAPVSALPDGRSAHGLLNMAGNVWEWTADRFHPESYRRLAAVDPVGMATETDVAERVVRGGSWQAPAYYLRAAARVPLADGERRADVGFRCAYDVRR